MYRTPLFTFHVTLHFFSTVPFRVKYCTKMGRIMIDYTALQYKKWLILAPPLPTTIVKCNNIYFLICILLFLILCVHFANNTEITLLQQHFKCRTFTDSRVILHDLTPLLLI